jgi:diguanylate cyclase (GGDEF)-like protein/PAS domain S-box-containing protein
MIWQTGLAELIRTYAYALLAISLARLFQERQTAMLGAKRWLIVVLLAGMAVLQAGLLGVWRFGSPALAHDVGLFAASCLLAVSLSLWPFLNYVKRRLNLTLDEQIRRRLRLAEARAAEARHWLLMAEEVANVGHWRIGFPDHQLFWSDGIYRIHGLSRSAFTPDLEMAIDRFHPDDRQIVTQAIEQAAAGKPKYEFSARLIRPDGEIRHVLSRGVVQFSETGAVVSIFGVLLDLTEQKVTEDRLRAANLAAATANRALQELALADALTGLPNRRHFDAALGVEFRRAVRDGITLGLVMVDLDHFKPFNDIYGHPAGDECLRKEAAAIAAVARPPGDLVARYGGEEIVLLLPRTNLAGAKALAARIAAVVHELNISHLGSPEGRVTASCGVAVFAPGEDPAPPAIELVERADRALYAAKDAGRNRVACHPIGESEAADH